MGNVRKHIIYSRVNHKGRRPHSLAVALIFCSQVQPTYNYTEVASLEIIAESDVALRRDTDYGRKSFFRPSRLI